MNVNEIFALGVDIAVKGLPTSRVIPVLQAVTEDLSSGGTDTSGFVNFLLSAAPYYIAVMIVIFIAIIILKIISNKREKKLGSQPQENRFDLDDFELGVDLKEKKETEENDST